MSRYLRNCLLAFACYGGLAAAAEPGRGELLYTTHCGACHGEQVHWRDKKLARNWKSLVGEVNRWQTNAKLRWNGDDVEAVALYLNAVFYRYRQPEK